MTSQPQQCGLWLIGGGGSVAATVALGVSAARRGRDIHTGMTTMLDPFAGLPLCPVDAFVIGGHEIRTANPRDTVEALHRRSNLFGRELIDGCAADLDEMAQNIRPGTLLHSADNLRQMADLSIKETSPVHTIDRLRDDLEDFRSRHRLARLVVINLASSEPAAGAELSALSYAAMAERLESASKPVPNSCLYALAAIEAGCAYVNFTPSTGSDLPAIVERADQLGALHMGSDGKTGETLVKSVLAPMFAMRNLRVEAWLGQNFLGNQDGKTLRDPDTRKAKVASKDALLGKILPGRVDTHVGIDYVESLDDWKIAWDLVRFEGFLGTKMNMQFTWQGSDSALAAPLVLDLARLADFALARDERGCMSHLAFYFKKPMGCVEHDLFSQWQRLMAYASRHRAAAPAAARPHG